jgi:hypothetical protein
LTDCFKWQSHKYSWTKNELPGLTIDYFNIPEHNLNTSSSMLHQHSWTHNRLTGSSAALRQYFWAKKWTDWFKRSFTSIFLNTNGLNFQVKDHINVPEHTVDWLVKVTNHVSIPENKKDWLIQVTNYTNIFL